MEQGRGGVWQWWCLLAQEENRALEVGEVADALPVGVPPSPGILVVGWQLYGAAECVAGVQVEVRLKKAATGTWPSLEARGAEAPANWSAPTAPPVKVYPSSRPQVRRAAFLRPTPSSRSAVRRGRGQCPAWWGCKERHWVRV
jgi:hypothetical protein